MTPTDDSSYEFDGFTLNPRERLLFYFNKRINLADKDFDILTYLVQNANVLITNKVLLDAVWGEERNIHHGNISNHIAKIRKALNCDPQKPRFIETIHNKGGYRFISKVSQIQMSVSNSLAVDRKSRDFHIESHLIAPVFLGHGAYEKIYGPDKETAWAKYKEFKIDNGRLCVFPTGIGVWHLTGKHQLISFKDIARWRYDTYKALLGGKHSIHLYNNELGVPLISRAINEFASVLGKVGYVFSVMVLREPEWVPAVKLRRPMKLLSHLSQLEAIETTKASNLERKILDGAYPDSEAKEFGSPGQDMGFASWDGVSYLEQSDRNSATKNDLIEFEIAVQTTWWLARCLSDIYLANGSRVNKDLTMAVNDLKWQYAKVNGILATESTTQRTMVEAVIETSRIRRLVDETIKIYDQQ